MPCSFLKLKNKLNKTSKKKLKFIIVKNAKSQYTIHLWDAYWYTYEINFSVKTMTF